MLASLEECWMLYKMADASCAKLTPSALKNINSSKKHKLNFNKWKDNAVKIARNSGKKYYIYNRKGNAVQEKTPSYQMNAEAISPDSDEVVAMVRKEFGLNEARIAESVQLLRDWLILQPHLPQDIEDAMLERWLIRCKNSLEKTKKGIDVYYTMRTLSPELVLQWTTKASWFLTGSRNMNFFPLPQRTPKGERVSVMWIPTADSSSFDLVEIINVTLMVYYISLREDYSTGETFIVDLKNLSMGHVLRVNLGALKKWAVFTLNGMKARMHAIHVMNLAPYAEIVIQMVKSVLPPKVGSRLHVHSTDLSKLYEDVPRRILPKEYGGDAGSMEELWDCCLQKMESYNPIYAVENKRKSDEERRPGGKMSASELFGIEGSFRKLNLD